MKYSNPVILLILKIFKYPEPMSPGEWMTGRIQRKPTKRMALREASFGRDHRSGPSFVYYIGLVMTIKTCHIKALHITSAACTTHVLSIPSQKVPDGKVLNM